MLGPALLMGPQGIGDTLPGLDRLLEDLSFNSTSVSKGPLDLERMVSPFRTAPPPPVSSLVKKQ